LKTLYARKLQQLKELSQARPDIRIGGFPEERYEMMYHRYEEVSKEEGFARVFRNVDVSPAKRLRRQRRTRARTIDKLEPLPLFVQ